MSHSCAARYAGLLAALCGVAGCGQSGPTAAVSVGGTVCVDAKSGEVVVLPGVDRFPAVNPASGAATLMPGLYCPKCQTWHAAPPLEQLHRLRGVARCPKTGTSLHLDGSRPAAAVPL